MKLTYEDKVRIYELRKQGISLKRISEKYEMNLSKLLTSQSLSISLLIIAQSIKKNQPVLTDFSSHDYAKIYSGDTKILICDLS